MFVAFEAVRVSRNPNLNPVKSSTKDISQLVQPKMKFLLFRVNRIKSMTILGFTVLHILIFQMINVLLTPVLRVGIIQKVIHSRQKTPILN